MEENNNGEGLREDRGTVLGKIEDRGTVLVS